MIREGYPSDTERTKNCKLNNLQSVSLTGPAEHCAGGSTWMS